MSRVPCVRSRRKIASLVLVVTILGALVAALFSTRGLNFVLARNHSQPLRTHHVAFGLLPESVNVLEKESYSHEFSVPNDALNVHLDGEFTVRPRAQGHLDMLVVSAAGFPHWEQFLPPTSAGSNLHSEELIYHTGNTIADLFQIKLKPGTYYLIFDYGPPTGATWSDHFGGFGGSYRVADTKITLNYDLPQEIP